MTPPGYAVRFIGHTSRFAEAIALIDAELDRGLGYQESSQPSRQRVADFDMETMFAIGESGRLHPEQEQAESEAGRGRCIVWG